MKVKRALIFKLNKAFIKQLIMHVGGMESKVGTMLNKVNKSFNIHLLTVYECYMSAFPLDSVVAVVL